VSPAAPPGPGPSPAPPYRCTEASCELDESQAGTASTVRAFVLLETPGPWGVDAVVDSRLPPAVRHQLLALEPDAGVRPLLIRRPGRSTGQRPVRVFVAYADAEQRWLETQLLDRPEELHHLDLGSVGRGRRLGLDATDDPVLLVCTHGRHDACCAERGRPLASALATVAPEQTWEVSHVGGDRFAANVVVLPDGLYYGRLAVEDADVFAADVLARRLDLDHLRGRSAYPFAVQAAEIALRRHLLAGGFDGLGLDAVRLVARRRLGGETTAVFATGDGTWTVRVASQRAESRRLSCRAGQEGRALTHRVVDLTPG